MRTKPKRKEFHIRLDGELADKVVVQARREYTTPPRLVNKIVSVYFNARRP